MVRKAKKEDLAQIKSLIDQGAKNSKILPRSRREIAGVLDCFYVGVVSGRVVGCCALEIYNKKMAEIRSLVVDPQFQGQGLGTKLVTACLQKAKRKKIYEVLAITDQESLFGRLGFAKQLANQWPMFIRPLLK